MHPPGLADAVTSELAAFFGDRRASAAAVDEVFAAAVDQLERFVLQGGKRVRPAFAWWGWRGAGGAGEAPTVLRACAALELVQACALVHDDLMDDSNTRRGHPTVHVAFAAHHRAQGWTGHPERFGRAAAVLLGDLALAWADDMLRASGLSPAQHAAATPVWEAMRTELLGGQWLDVLGEVRDDESDASATRTARFKTAAYTIERPLHLGAALAGAPEPVVAAYRSFGADVGVAFQLRDDMLGVFGDPEVTGKPAGDDLREGKRTVLLALALATADEKDPAAAALLRGSLGHEMSAATLDNVRGLLVELGAVSAVEHRIDALTTRGLVTLRAADVTAEARDALHTMALAATSRTH